MEESGIAMATVIVQLLNSIYLIYRIKKLGLFNNLKKRYLKFNINYVKKIISIGFPSSISLLSISVGFIIINNFIYTVGDSLSLAGYGSAIRIEQISLIPLMGIKQALQVFIAQNFGAKNINRIQKSIKVSILICLGIWLFIYLPILFFSSQLLSLFNDNKNVIYMGQLYLQVQSITFFAYIINTMHDGALQAIKKPQITMYLNFSRQVVIPLILFYGIFSNFGISGVFYTGLTSNVIVSIIFFIYTRKKISSL